MVKTPRTRHSKTERDPMTIELGPDEVSRVATEGEASSADAESAAEGVKEDVGASAKRLPNRLSKRRAMPRRQSPKPRRANRTPAFDRGADACRKLRRLAMTPQNRSGHHLPRRSRRSRRNPALAAVARLGARRRPCRRFDRACRRRAAAIRRHPRYAGRRSTAPASVEAGNCRAEVRDRRPEGRCGQCRRRVGQGRRSLAGARPGENRRRLATQAVESGGAAKPGWQALEHQDRRDRDQDRRRSARSRRRNAGRDR